MKEETTELEQIEPVSIFEDAESEKIAMHQGKIRTAQRIMYILAVIRFVGIGIYYYNAQETFGADPISLYINNGEAQGEIFVLVFGLLVCLIFAVLAYFTPKRPIMALGSGLVLYAALIVINAVNNPMAAIFRLLAQSLLIIPMVVGFINARALEKMQRSGHNE